MKAACDTSILIPALLPWHPAHADCRPAMRGVEVVPAHVIAEAYSTMTRLPADFQLAAQDARALLAPLADRVVGLDASEYVHVVERLAARAIGGGAVYDGLVGATAAASDAVLLTRDRRARETYEVLAVSYRLI